MTAAPWPQQNAHGGVSWAICFRPTSVPWLRSQPGAGPACAHECNLVDEIRNVVDHVEESVVHGTEQVAEEVSCRVDGPANSDDHAHGVERGCNSLAALTNKAASLTSEDLEQN